MRKLTDKQVESEIQDIMNDEKWARRGYVYMKNIDGKTGYMLNKDSRTKSPVELEPVDDDKNALEFTDLKAMVRAGWIVD